MPEQNARIYVYGTCGGSRIRLQIQEGCLLSNGFNRQLSAELFFESLLCCYVKSLKICPFRSRDLSNQTTILLLAGLVLLLAIQGWWASFGMRMRAHWTFVALLVIVLQAIGVYMAAALVLPDVTGDAIVDLRDHYFAHRSWFFGALFAPVVFSAAKDLALEGHLPDRMNLGVSHDLWRFGDYGRDHATRVVSQADDTRFCFTVIPLHHLAVRASVACNVSPVAQLRRGPGLFGKGASRLASGSDAAAY